MPKTVESQLDQLAVLEVDQVLLDILLAAQHVRTVNPRCAAHTVTITSLAICKAAASHKRAYVTKQELIEMRKLLAKLEDMA